MTVSLEKEQIQIIQFSYLFTFFQKVFLWITFRSSII